MRNRQVAPLALVSASLALGCSGAQFRLDERLAGTRAMRPTGALGLNTASCGEGKTEVPPGLARGEAVTVSLGPLRGTVHAPHRQLTTQRLVSEAVRADLEPILDALRTTAPIAPPVGQLAEDLDTLFSLPITQTETTVFTYVAEVEGRPLFTSCVVTSEAATFGVFDDPRFRLHCRLLAISSAEVRTLTMNGHGSWANYRFSGELRGDGEPPLAVASQSVEVLGAGAIRGFEVTKAGTQVAALSFWEEPSQDDPERYEARAWSGAIAPAARRDAVLATLGLAFVYPWPTGCDAQRMRGRALGEED